MRFPLPDQPSRLRKVLLAPATLLFAAGTALHRALWLRPARRLDPDPIPVIVIGSLRAGGAGKTPVTLELAKYLAAQGYRVGVLTYQIGHPRKSREKGSFSGGALRASGCAPSPPPPLPEGEGSTIIRHVSGCDEVFPDSDWRASSDEAVLLARALRGTEARVFATRDRARARSALAAHGAAPRDARPDVLISDDGLMDARLTRTPGVLRVALIRPGERPTLWDLLPAGPWRLTAAALADVEVVLREGEGFGRTALPPRPHPLPLSQACPRAGGGRGGGGEGATPQWVLTGLGNPQSFVRALMKSGVRIAGESHGPDHGLPDLKAARRAAHAQGVHHFICSPKDAIKLESHPNRPENLDVASESVWLSSDFQTRVRAFLNPPTS